MKNSNSCILSIDAGGTSLKAALLYENSIIKDTFFSVPSHSDGTEDEICFAYQTLGQIAATLEHRHNITITQCAVCIPGPFDYTGGRFLMNHKYQAVYQKALRPWLWEGIGRILPIQFLHDSTAFLLGACSSFPELVQRRICSVIIGTGLGFACMIDGRILEREDKGPGISIFGRSYLTKTAEDYISHRGILARYHELAPLSQTKANVKLLAISAYNGDKAAIQTFRELGTHLAAVLHPIVLEHRFECLLLGGAVSKSYDLFLPSLREGLSDISMDILPVTDLDYAPLLGSSQYLFY